MIDRIKSLHIRPDSVGKVLMIVSMYLLAYRSAAGPVLMLDGNTTVMRSVQIVLTVVFGLIHNCTVKECVEGRSSSFAAGDGVPFTLWTIVIILIIRRLLGVVFTMIPVQIIGVMTEAVVFVLGILHMMLTYIISLAVSVLLWKSVKVVLMGLQSILLRVSLIREESSRKREEEKKRWEMQHRISRIQPFAQEFCREDTQFNINNPGKYYDRYKYLQDINLEIYRLIGQRANANTEYNGYVHSWALDGVRDILDERLLDYEKVFNVRFTEQFYNKLVNDLNSIRDDSNKLRDIGYEDVDSFGMSHNDFCQAWYGYWKV